jgi:hypothetical protein
MKFVQLVLDRRTDHGVSTSNDCYHPNAAGDALLGTAIPLEVFG